MVQENKSGLVKLIFSTIKNPPFPNPWYTPAEHACYAESLYKGFIMKIYNMLEKCLQYMGR